MDFTGDMLEEDDEAIFSVTNEDRENDDGMDDIEVEVEVYWKAEHFFTEIEADQITNHWVEKIKQKITGVATTLVKLKLKLLELRAAKTGISLGQNATTFWRQNSSSMV